MRKIFNAINGKSLNEAIGLISGDKSPLEGKAILEDILPVDSVSYEGFSGYKTIRIPKGLLEQEEEKEPFIRKVKDSRDIHSKFVPAMEGQKETIESINSLLGDYYHLRCEDVDYAFLWESCYVLLTKLSQKREKDKWGKWIPVESRIMSKSQAKEWIRTKQASGMGLSEIKYLVITELSKLWKDKVEDMMASLYYKRDRLVKALEQDTKFFFSYYGDTCMRIYTKETDFSYQASSVFKSMIYSCYEERFTRAGRKQLESSIANAFGLEKKSREERAKWFNDNRNNLLDIKYQAKDYWKYTTLVREYENMLKHQAKRKLEKKGYSYRSGILVGFDASASGCSIMSLLTKDRKTAELTNTIKGDGCKDYYMEAYHLFQANAKKKGYDISDDLERDRIKKAIMTYWYNSYKNPDTMIRELSGDDKKKYYVLTEVWKDTLKELSPNLNIFKEEFNEVFAYLLNIVVDKDLSPNPDIKNIKWRTPDGVLNFVEFEEQESINFPFTRKYSYKGAVKEQTFIVKNFKYSVNKNTYHNAWRSVLPRFIHSIDAYIMRNVVKNFKEALPKAPIFCNHDCFYIHPNHYDVLMKCYKEQLVEVAKPEFLKTMIFLIFEENNIDVDLDKEKLKFSMSGIRGSKRGMSLKRLLEWEESFSSDDILGGEYTLY